MADNVNIEITPIINDIDIAVTQAVKGDAGTNGTNGTNGIDGTDGADGLGVPSGGTTGQVLSKVSATDNDTEWADAASGGVQTVVSGTGINVVSTDTANPIVNVADRYLDSSVISALDVNWSSSFAYTKTLGVNTTFTFSNLYIGVKTLILTGNFTVAFPTGFTLTNGSEAYDGTKECLVEIICYDTSTPKGLINITYSV